MPNPLQIKKNRKTVMDLALIYRKIEKRLAKVNFSALWTGFSSLKFAVYTDEACYFDGHYIEKTDFFALTHPYSSMANI